MKPVVKKLKERPAGAPTDRALLGALVESGKLSDVEDSAFRDMLEKLEFKPGSSLSPDQRGWADKVYRKLGLDDEEGCHNLVSRGLVKVTSAERAKKFGYELAPRPLKPPGQS